MLLEGAYECEWDRDIGAGGENSDGDADDDDDDEDRGGAVNACAIDCETSERRIEARLWFFEILKGGTSQSLDP